MLLSKCAVCGRKKSRFIKQQEVSGLLLGDNSTFKGIPTLGIIL